MLYSYSLPVFVQFDMDVKISDLSVAFSAVGKHALKGFLLGVTAQMIEEIVNVADQLGAGPKLANEQLSAWVVFFEVYELENDELFRVGSQSVVSLDPGNFVVNSWNLIDLPLVVEVEGISDG